MAEKDHADEFSDRFMSMPDRYKKLFLKYIYILVSENRMNDVWTLINIIGFPEYCESPIEQILWLALNVYPLFFDKRYYFEEQTEIETNGKTYRVDFLYSEDYDKKVEKPFRLVIECDGHEFHEATKEQVEKRNKRDIALKMAGYDVLHYSGSQIFKKPGICATEIYDYITKRLEEKGNG